MHETRLDVVFGAARVYTVTVPGPKWKSWLKGLAALGVPSISLSYGLNEIDDAVAAKIPTNLTLRADSIDGPGLARHIAEILANGSQASVAAQSAPGGRNGRVAAAEKIAGMIDRAKAARAPA